MYVSRKVAAFTDSYALVHLYGETLEITVRTSECEMLVHEEKRKPCFTYRRTLRVLQDKWSNCSSEELSSSSTPTNNRYLNMPQKC